MSRHKISSEPKTMDELTLNLPHVANGVRKIGDLWDCRNTAALGSNIFLENKLEATQDFLEVVPVHDMKYNLSRVKDSNGKSEIVGISVEIAFEIAGTIAVEGAASFKKEEEKKLDQDEFLCNYEVQTFVVRTRPSVSDPSKEVINPSVKKRIDVGSIVPTHFVSEVRLGGNTYARLRIKDTVDHDNLEISGSFGGKFPVGPINFGIKASIEFQEKESSSFYECDIVIDSRPGGSGTVTTISDMFKYVEGLPLAIEEQEPYLPKDVFLVDVKGVPMSYKLTPLSHLFELNPREDAYVLLQREIMTQFNEMIFTLYDVEGVESDYFRKLVREKEPRVLALFQSQEGDPNPWVVEVDKYQTLKEREATALRREATDVMMDYKWGKVTLEDIMEILDRYRRNFDLPGIHQKAEEMAEDGRGILRGLRFADATGCGVPNIFIFSPSELQLLEGGDVGLKIILRTNGSGPQGVHIKFYALASSLSSLEFTVRAAPPNISEDFSLTIKINGDSKIKYMGNELLFALHILKQITLAKTKTFSAAAAFLNIYTTIRFSKPLAQLDTTLVNTFISNLQTNIKHVRFAETLLQSLEAISELQETKQHTQYTLLLPIRFPISSWDSYAIFSAFARSSEEEDSKISIVVGNFDLGSNSTAAPSALLLDRSSNVIAVCQNKLDRLILQHALANVNSTGDINVLAMNALHPKQIFNFPLQPLDAEFSAAVFELVDQSGDTSTATNEEKKNMSNCPFLNPFTSDEEEKAFNVVNNVLTSATVSGWAQLISEVFWAVGARHIFSSKLSPIIRDHGWTDQEGFPSEGVDWSSLLDDIREAKTELGLDTPPESMKDEPDYDSDNVKLDKIIDIVAYAVDENNRQLLTRLVMFFMEKFMHLQNPLGNHENLLIWKKLKTLESESDPEQVPLTNFLFKAMRIWQTAKYSEKYFQLWDYLDDNDGLQKLENSDDVIGFLIFVARNLSAEEQEWVWRNSKIRYWIETFKDNQVVMGRVYELFCDADQELIPGFVPPSLRSSLIQLMKQIKGEVLIWKNRLWEDVAEMLETFRFLEMQQAMPEDFMTVLTENLRENVNLYNALNAAGALFYWDEESMGFRHAWGTYSLRRVIDLVTESSPKETIKDASTQENSQIVEYFESKQQSPVFTLEDYLELDLPLRKVSPFAQSKSQIQQKIISRYTPYLFQTLKHGNYSVLSYDRVKSYFGYPTIADPTSILPHNHQNSDSAPQTSFFHFPLSTVFAPSLSCFNGPPPNFCYPDPNKYTLVKGNEDEEDGRNNLLPHQFISRSDLLTYLFERCEDAAVTELLASLSQSLSTIALPWFIPTDTSSTEDQLGSKNFTKCLKSITISSSHFDQIPSKAEYFLTPPYKLILCIRVGNRKNTTIGKSTMLNNSILSGNQFASKLEPGYSNGQPLRRRGFIELVPLSKSTCSPEFYNNFLKPYEDCHKEKPVLLGNVHGAFNALNFSDPVLDTLIQHSSSLVVFWDSENWRELQNTRLELDELLATRKTNNDIPRYNIILDPDETISVNVDTYNILTTKDSLYVPRMGRIFNRVLLMTTPLYNKPEIAVAVTDLTPAEVLLDLIDLYSIPVVKASLALQHLPRCELLAKWEQIIVNPVWTEVMAAFYNLLQLLPYSQRSIQMQQIQRHLHQMTSDVWNTCSENVSLLRRSFFNSSATTDSGKRSFTIRDEVSKEVKFFGMNVLTLSNFFEEINTLTELAEEEKVAELFPDYKDRLAEAILLGCPMQISPSESIAIKSAFQQIHDGLQIVSLSILDFSLDTTSLRELIHSLFGVEFCLGLDAGKPGFNFQFVLCTQKMRAHFGLAAKVYGILLSVGQGLGSPERDMREKNEIATLLLATSDLALVYLGILDNIFLKSNWSTVMGTGFLTMGLLEKEEVTADVAFVGILRQKNSPATEKENGVLIYSEVAQTIRDLLGSTSSLAKTSLLQGRFRNSVFEGLDSTVIRLFDGTLCHLLQSSRHVEDSQQDLVQLQNHIFESLKFREGRSFANWFQNVAHAWDTLMYIPSFQFALSSTQDSYKLFLERNVFILEIKRLLDRVFQSHENIYIKQIEGGEKPFFDFDILNKVPYFCTLEESDGCDCAQSVPRIQIMLQRLDALGGSLLEKEADLYDIHCYTFALKNQLIENISRQTVGIPEPHLRISTPWTEYVLVEVEKEYGPRFKTDIEKEDATPTLDTVIAYDLRHEGKVLDILTKSNGRSLGEEKLGWEAAIWLQLQIEMMVKQDVLHEPRYQSGMVRNLREKIQRLLDGDFYQKFCLDEVMHLGFYWDAHKFGISLYLKSWETRFFSWNIIDE